MKIQVVEFDGYHFALISEQNDWTGNYMYSMRKVRGGYGEEFVNYNGGRVSVKRECEKLREENAHFRGMEKRIRELEKRL